MGRSEFVVAIWFHAAILAIVVGCPVLPVIYSDKARYVLENLGFDGPMIALRTCQDYMVSGYRQHLWWTDKSLPGMLKSILISWTGY